MNPPLDSNYTNDNSIEILVVSAPWCFPGQVKSMLEQVQRYVTSAASDDEENNMNNGNGRPVRMTHKRITYQCLEDEVIDLLKCPAQLPAVGIYTLGEDGPVEWVGEERNGVSVLDGGKVRKVIKRMNEAGVDVNLKKRKNNSVADTQVAITSMKDIRLFIAGDKSQVGKSTVCLGLLGSLLKAGYPASKLAYIKPATQCEEEQLVAKFCAAKGIDCRPIGPIVYYKGFTRAHLEGKTDSTDVLLERAAKAVDEISVGKAIVIIDGVGYPSVGSICGTSNASVAKACGQQKSKSASHKRCSIPVLLVGKSGVGDAVDSYNLNATYFEKQGLPVIGCIFNRLSKNGFYALNNCKTAIDKYFALNRPHQIPFGYIPDLSQDMTPEEKNTVSGAAKIIDIFNKSVDVKAIIRAASSYSLESNTELQQKPVSKRSKYSSIVLDTPKLSRIQIERTAKSQGAAGG